MTRTCYRTLCIVLLLSATFNGVECVAVDVKVLDKIGFDQRLNSQIPVYLTFTDSSGRKIQLSDCLHSKPAILLPVYYGCPMMCSAELSNLTKSLRTLTQSAGTDFNVIVVSIDPAESASQAEQKKRECCRNYGRSNAENGWKFLVGSKNDIEELCRAIGYRYQYTPETGQYAHPSGIVVLTAEGRVSRYLFGIDYFPKDIRFALIEAGRGAIGSFSDKVLLYCYRYDLDRGTYSVAILRIVQVAALLTVALLSTAIGWLSWRHKFKQTAQTTEK